MNNEEMNQKMEFIVEHQAKFAAELEMMREVQAADAKRFTDAIMGLVDIVGSLARSQMSADGRIAELQARTDESMTRLSEAQAQTEESLKALINTVERHIGGNGGSHGHP